jgi:hypothetical protein
LNAATGAKEKSEAERIDRRGGLKLVSKSQCKDDSRKLFRIGICENVFKARERKLDDQSETPSQGAPEEGSPPELVGLPVVLTCSLLGLLLGYLIGKSDR